MATMQESSVLFSLNQVLSLHEEQMRAEEEAQRAREEAMRLAREEAARIEAESAAKKAAEEAARLAREQAAQREEAARIEAQRLAAIEQARVEAEGRARIEMMRAAEAHEQALVALREDAKKKKLKRALLSTVFGAIALIGGGMGLYFGKIKPDNDARLQDQAAAINAQDEETARLRAKLDANGKRIEEVEARLRAEQDRANTLKSDPPPSEPVTTKLPQRPATTNKTTETPKSTEKCLPGEPGCGLDGTRIF